MSTIIHAFMRPRPGYDISEPEPAPRQTNRSGARTAAIVAGGAGLAYGGVKVGRAADQVKKTAAAAEDAAKKSAKAAEHVEAVAGGVRKVGRAVAAPIRAVRRVFKFATPPGASVAKDRYVKGIHEKDVDRATGQYVKSGLAGAALGLALRKPAMTRQKAALVGATGGLLAQGATRVATGTTKDQFGDRSPGAKVVDKLPAAALAGTAIVTGSPRIRRTIAKIPTKVGRAAGRAVRQAVRAFGVGNAVRRIGQRVQQSEHFIPGLALMGGIAAADAATSAAMPEHGKTRAQAAASGLGRGALYGGILAAAEPALAGGLKRAMRPKIGRAMVPVARAFGTRGRTIAFRGREQYYTDTATAKGVFADPLKVASGEQKGYTRDEHGNKAYDQPAFRHAQVLNAAVNKGRDLHKWGGRSGRIVSDVADVARGKRKVDERGRPLKREWEKSYFKNLVGAGLGAAAVLGHHKAMRDHPGYRHHVGEAISKVKRTGNSLIPDLFPLAASLRKGVVAFDATAPDWDVRDSRGRSARVFAPGSRSVERREKRWHEKVANIRKLAVAGALIAAAGGGAAGYRYGKRAGVKATAKAAKAKAAYGDPLKTASAHNVDEVLHKRGGGPPSGIIWNSARPRRVITLG